MTQNLDFDDFACSLGRTVTYRGSDGNDRAAIVVGYGDEGPDMMVYRNGPNDHLTDGTRYGWQNHLRNVEYGDEPGMWRFPDRQPWSP